MKFTFYEGKEKPVVVYGKHCCRMAEFAEKYRAWHSFKNDKQTRMSVLSLQKRVAIEVNEFCQFRWRQA